MAIPRSGFAPIRPVVIAGAIYAGTMLSASAIGLHCMLGGPVGLHPLGVVCANLSQEFGLSKQYGISENLARLAMADYSSKTTHDSGYAAALYYTGLGAAARNDQATAEPYLKHSLTILYNLKPECKGHRAHLAPLENLASFYVDRHQPQLALQLYEAQLSRLEEQKQELQNLDLPVDYDYLAKIYNSAAEFNYLLGYYGRSEEFSKRSNILFKMSGRRDDARIYENNLFAALALVKQFRYAEAEPYLLACKRHEDFSYRGTPTDQITRLMLAYVYEMTNRSQLSKETCDGSAIALITAGPVNDNGTLRAWASDLLAARHQYVEAQSMLTPLIQDLRGELDRDNPTLLKMEERLAKLYFYQGNFKAARKATVKIIALREKKLGYWSCDTARSYCLLGTIDRRLGDREKAQASWTVAANIWNINQGTLP